LFQFVVVVATIAGLVVADSDPKAQLNPLDVAPYTAAAGLDFT
jgi:hypothetical protein